jgi:GNAT superfamily N-acetyltransferase
MSNDILGLHGQETLLACWTALAQLSPGAKVVRIDGAIAAVFPSWAPLNNAILCGDDRGSSAAETAALRRIYDEAGVPVWALWRPARTPDLDTADTAPELGELKRDTTTLVMQVSLQEQFRPDPAVVPAPIAVVAELDEDVTVTADEIVAPDDVPGLSGWAFIHDGLAVAAAWSFVHGSDCGIYALETLTPWRRRGFARSLMAHVLANANDRGARTATLQSTRRGQPLYESLGFAPLGRYEEWIWQ